MEGLAQPGSPAAIAIAYAIAARGVAAAGLTGWVLAIRRW